MPLNSNQISHFFSFDDRFNDTTSKKTIRHWMADLNCISWEFTETVDYNEKYTWEEFRNHVIPKLKRSIISDIASK